MRGSIPQAGGFYGKGRIRCGWPNCPLSLKSYQAGSIEPSHTHPYISFATFSDESLEECNKNGTQIDSISAIISSDESHEKMTRDDTITKSDHTNDSSRGIDIYIYTYQNFTFVLPTVPNKLT